MHEDLRNPPPERRPAWHGLLLGSCLLVLGGLFAYWVNRPTDDPAMTTAIEALGQQLGRIEGRLDRLEQRSARSHSISPAGSGILAGTGDNAGMTPEQQRVQAESEARQTRAALDAQFKQSPGSNARELGASRELLDATRSEDLVRVSVAKPDASDIRCRGGLCRMEFSFADHAAAEDWGTFYAPLTAEHIESSQTFVERNPGGGATLLVYGQMR